DTAASHQAGIAPDPPCDTAGFPPLHRDRLQSVAPSAQAASDSPAPVPLPRCTTLRPLPPVPAPSAHPAHTPAYSLSADRSVSLLPDAHPPHRPHGPHTPPPSLGIHTH